MVAFLLIQTVTLSTEESQESINILKSNFYMQGYMSDSEEMELMTMQVAQRCSKSNIRKYQNCRR